ncbi:MAG: 50S ribosomal protein L14e [Candidatus Woesearchaeota archaeon]
MIEIGRVCVKTAGRDAGRKCIIVEILDKNRVLIDGQTRRRQCNVAHLEPLNQTIQIKQGATHSEVTEALKTIGIETRETKPRQKTTRPRQIRKKKSIEPETKKGKTSKGK